MGECDAGNMVTGLVLEWYMQEVIITNHST